MSRKTFAVILALLILSSFVGFSPLVQLTADEIYEHMLSRIDPLLLRQAEKKGLYDREEFPVLRDINPFFIRGDFNGDGEMDLAFWVKKKDSDLQGVTIIHSTLDTLYLFGAGRPRPPGGGNSVKVSVDAWHLLPPGYVGNHIYGNIPEIGVVEGRPFTFERETLEFLYLGKSAFVFYWAKGQYWEFWTAD
ncbi:hypothetical protein AMJ80_00950 [bacterium SM23_31]|nr:MAG: hypothetical protein AMJ80_00950 [bacterium SM23_31]